VESHIFTNWRPAKCYWSLVSWNWNLNQFGLEPNERMNHGLHKLFIGLLDASCRLKLTRFCLELGPLYFPSSSVAYIFEEVVDSLRNQVKIIHSSHMCSIVICSNQHHGSRPHQLVDVTIRGPLLLLYLLENMSHDFVSTAGLQAADCGE
jgi:hypothetical protein